MIGISGNYAAPNAASRRFVVEALPLRPAQVVLESRMPRVAKVWVGGEPVVILMEAHRNVLLGIVANRWSAGVDKLLDRILSKGEDAKCRRSDVLQGVLGVGFVYLSYKASAMLTRDAAVCMVLRRTLKGALHVADASAGLMLSDGSHKGTEAQSFEGGES